MTKIGTVNTNGVLFGHNDMLFLVGSRARMERLRAPFPESIFAGAVAAFEARRARAHALGSLYRPLYVPPRETFYRSNYTGPLRDYTDERARLMATGLYDAAPRMRATPGPAFWNTDFHLAPHGAVAIALSIAEATGLVADATLAYAAQSLPNMIEAVDEPFLGEIGMRCTPPITEPKLVFRPPVSIQASAFDGPADLKQKHPQEGDLVIAYSPEALVDKTVVVFGTSLVNAVMRPLSLVFSTVIWARTHQYVYWDVVEAARADAVISLYSGATIDTCFPIEDANAPPFMAIPKITGRKLTLRDTNVGLFAQVLPGLIAKSMVPSVVSPTWRNDVIGTKGYVIDDNRRNHGVPVPPETVTPAPGIN